MGTTKKRPGINPPKRRAVDVTSEDSGKSYETHAVKYLEANERKNAEARVERDEFAACWQDMAKLEVARFEFDFTNSAGKTSTYVAAIAGSDKTELDVAALYQMFKNEEITEEQFLASIKCESQATVKKQIGANGYMKISSTVPTEAKLTIKEKK